MNILELDSFNLADAVKFNDRLNPRLWQGERMRPEIREQLLKIAADFKESLGIDDLDVEDITVSGSNAGYTYTPHSDIDLHLVVRLPNQCDEVYQELFNAKKYQYNDEHNIKIGGYDVELYVQPADQSHVSAGVYSLKNNDWIHIPRRIAASVDDAVVKDKYDLVKAKIDSALKSNSIDKMRKLWAKIKEMRKAGLAKNGELGPENLTFKMLRTQGDLGKLKDTIQRAKDAELSLAEQNREKRPFVYGFKTVGEDVTLTPDGVSPSTKMFLSEKDTPEHSEIIRDFIKFAVKKIGLKKLPKFKLHKDPAWSVKNKSFGRYSNDTDTIDLCTGDRHIMDVLRTLAHELQHRKQDEREQMPANAGATGSPYENEANAFAGILMREYAAMHPEYFQDVPVSESVLNGNKIKEAEKFNWADWAQIDPITGQGLSTESVMEICETYLLKTRNLLESNTTEGVSYFKDLFNLGVKPVPGSKYLMTMLMLVNDKILVSHGIEIVKVIKETSPGEYIVKLPNGRTAKFPQNAAMSSTMHHTFFFTNKSQYEKLKTAIKLKFNTDLNESASGYIPTKAQSKDPRYSMALTVDIKPGQVGKEANKMALDTNKQGKPSLIMKSVNQLAESLQQEYQRLKEEDIFEIRMGTSNLRQLAAKTGAKAGMEFEMIVPNVANADSDDMEPNYDEDQRARSIGDIVSFFDDGDFNGRREIRRLEEELNSAYQEWKWDQLSDKWADEGYEFFIQYIEDQDVFDRDEALDTARDEFIDANPDIPVDSEEAQRGISARVDELEQEFIQEEWDNQGVFYERAQEDFNDVYSDEFDESDWLRSESYHSMSDIQNNFDIQWPYWTSSGDGEADIEAVSNEFEDMIGRPVHWSTSYHGATRSPNAYSVEPDGSLDADAPGDSGLEFISPPLPIDEMISDLNKVKEWAGRYGCYTNDSTGLHINISVPGYSLDKLDYVKLALLMGDEYVLDLFGRASNTYAKAATGKIKNAIRTNPSVVADLLDKMRGHMGDLATKAIHSGTTDKYTSINTKNGYIEFRSPGGDWLDANFDKIENTLLRFTVALSAAIDPQAYRQEYQKKLYKLLSASQDKGGPDVVQLFANYSAGELDKAGLIRQVRQQQTARAVKSGKTYGKKFWWSVTNPANSFASIEVVAKSKEEAINVALEPGNYPEWARVRDSLDATPIRPYQEPSASGNTASWGLFRVSDNTRMKAHGNYVQFDNVTQADAQKQADELIARTSFSPSNFEIRKVEAPGAGQPQTPMGGQSHPREPAAGRIEYQIFNRNDNSAVVAMMADNDEQALERLGRYRADHPGNWGVRRAGEPDGFDTNNDNYGATERRGDLTPRGPGPWEIYRISDNSSVRELSNTSRSAAEQEARTALGLRAEAPELYGVRTRQTAATTNYRGPWEIFRIEDGRVMGTIAAGNHAEAEVEMERRARNASYDPDVLDIRPAQQSAAQPGDVVAPGLGEVPANANQVGQIYTPAGRGEFTGQWMILDPHNRILHKIGGIGNNQSDANRHALRWLQQHPEHMQDGVTIVPEMG